MLNALNINFVYDDICHIYNFRHAVTSLYELLYKISKIYVKYEIFKGKKPYKLWTSFVLVLLNASSVFENTGQIQEFRTS